MSFSLKNFSKRQLEVITHVSGPLLVISGAGTGKTHVLTGRVLQLILQNNVPASQILALTFTEKAASEMKQRVMELLPLGHPEAEINTFHAFGEKILRESGHEIGMAPDYRLLGEADLWLFLKRHALEFPLHYYRTPTNPKKFLYVLQRYFSRLQDEDISPEQYQAYLEKRRKQAAGVEDPAAEEEWLKKHQELARCYTLYQELLLREGVVDYGGLISQTLRLLRDHPSLLREFSERFQYIMVDEFQDMNFAQSQIVNLLAERHQNIMVVGDDDQSIYKWRGASLSNIQSFEKAFPKAKKIVLSENYRSSQPILDFAYQMIQRNNPNRLEASESIDKKLTAKSSRKEHLPEIHSFGTVGEEVDYILDTARALIRKGQNTAILVRTNALARYFTEKLKLSDIVFQHFSSDAIVQKESVRDCLALLRVLCDPWDDLAVFRLLSLPHWGIPMEELLALTRRAKQRHSSLYELLAETEYDTLKILLSRLIEDSRTSKPSTILGIFLEESRYLEEARQSDDDKLHDIARFSELITRFEERHAAPRVQDLLEYIELLQESGGEARNDVTMLDPDALKILSIHGAKGLEFDAVFLPGLVQGKFPTITRREPLEIPQDLIPEALPQGDHHLEEERRLFYVASTRAREKLFLTYSENYEGRKQWKPSIFIAEAQESGKAVMKGRPKGTHQSQPSLELEEREHKPLSASQPADMPIKLSYSQIDTFQMCPQKFRYRYRDQIATPASGAMNFGISIHNTLRAWYELLKVQSELPEEEKILVLKHCFEKQWISGGYENRHIHDDQKEQAWSMLERYYEAEKNNLILPAYTEKAFTLKLSGTTLTGRIDRIDLLPDGTYEVIDYKTGEAKDFTVRELGNDVQLSLYALACRDALKLPVSKLSLYYLSELKKFSTTRTDKALDAFKNKLEESAIEIASSDFSPTPGFHCGFCDYQFICPAALSNAYAAA